jgi:hypothetical protein
MTSWDAHDACAYGLDRLTTLAPDPGRAERLRAKCRARLARSRQREARAAAITGFAWRVLGPGVVGAFCVFYVALLMATTRRLFH